MQTLQKHRDVANPVACQSGPIGGEPIENLADPSKWGDLDERDPKSMARMMKRMGKELGEDVENVDEMIDEAMEEEMGTTSDKEPED